MDKHLLVVPAELFYYSITVITKFHIVTEPRVHQGRVGPHHTVQQQAEREHLLCYDQVYSAPLVKPTLLDPTSGSTTTWPTPTRCRCYINMLFVLKQQTRKRELPSVLEGNKQAEQQGPTTTLKNCAAEVQIYMSLEDHNLATIMED
eukprot:3605619-Amphidinium_carterae.1